MLIVSATRTTLRAVQLPAAAGIAAVPAWLLFGPPAGIAALSLGGLLGIAASFRSDLARRAAGLLSGAALGALSFALRWEPMFLAGLAVAAFPLGDWIAGSERARIPAILLTLFPLLVFGWRIGLGADRGGEVLAWTLLTLAGLAPVFGAWLRVPMATSGPARGLPSPPHARGRA